MTEPNPAFLFSGADLLLPPGASPEAPASLSGLPPLLGADAAVSGFGFEGLRFLAAELAGGAAELLEGSGWRREALRSYIGSAPQRSAALALKARAYAHWASVSKFCSACGDRLERGRGPEAEGGMTCPSCGRTFFPRISPAVIVLVSRGEELLLAHNVKFPTGRHGLVAGFVEPGETLEECLRRELMEEAGIEVGEPRYVRSQPWPFPDSLMLGFEADWVSGEARPDGLEIDSLGWFRWDALPAIPPPGSVARFLIDRFVARRSDLNRS